MRCSVTLCFDFFGRWPCLLVPRASFIMSSSCSSWHSAKLSGMAEYLHWCLAFVVLPYFFCSISSANNWKLQFLDMSYGNKHDLFFAWCFLNQLSFHKNSYFHRALISTVKTLVKPDIALFPTFSKCLIFECK